jgi:SAM-dependent methyltransferase
LSAPLPHYALGASDDEHRRLIHLASHEEDRVVDACRRAAVPRGATVLDLGCGPLGALGALAHVVGEHGTVIGIDASGPALEKARAMLPPHVRFVHADVNEVTPEQLGVERADVAYCRLMLVHQADPARTLRNIAKLVRPGGVVIAHEPSDLAIHAPASEPHVPAVTRVWELVLSAAHARGATTDFGRKGRMYFERAGLTVESHRGYVVHYPPDVGYDIPRVALHSLRPTLEQRGLASEEEIERLDREIEEAKRHSDVQWVSSPFMLEWIGRKGLE